MMPATSAVVHLQFLFIECHLVPLSVSHNRLADTPNRCIQLFNIEFVVKGARNVDRFWAANITMGIKYE
jgi:hypothetical protein